MSRPCAPRSLFASRTRKRAGFVAALAAYVSTGAAIARDAAVPAADTAAEVVPGLLALQEGILPDDVSVSSLFAVLDVLGVVSEHGGQEEALAFFHPDALPQAFLLLVGAAIAVRLLHRIAGGIADRFTVHRLAIKQGVTLAGFALYAAGGVAAIGTVFELSAQALFALSGTLAVAAGFLLKDIAESIVAGLSILISRPFSVGDRISFGGYYGEVRDIGLRTVRLVTLDDNLVTIPSSKFLSDSVASANAGALDCMVVMTFHLSADADYERAREIVRDAVMSSRFCYLGKPITVLIATRLVDQIGVVLEIVAKAYVFDARHEKSFASDVTDRVLRAWREAGIALPTPARAA